MQQYLNILENWLCTNYLSLNLQKTLTFSIYIDKLPNYYTSENNNFKLKIGNTEIRNVTSCKYFGVTLDQHMRWDIHIDNVIKKLRYLLSIFTRLKFILRRRQLLSIYYGLFNSVASYGIQ